MKKGLKNRSGYIVGNSIVHRIDARIKLAFIMLFICVTVVSFNIKILLVLSAITTFIIFLSKIDFSFFLERVKFFTWFLLITAVMHLFFTEGETIQLFPMNFLNITYEGMESCYLTLFRLTLILLMTFLFTCTTSSHNIAKGIQSLLSPLSRKNPQIQEISSIVLMTFQFIPILLSLAEDHIQDNRLTDHKNMTLKERLHWLMDMVDQYFKNAIENAEDLAEEILSKD